jgi:hypothetical protein
MKGNLRKCPLCGRFIQSLGLARHRSMHYSRTKKKGIAIMPKPNITQEEGK